MTVVTNAARSVDSGGWKARAGRAVPLYALPILIGLVIVVASTTTAGFAEGANFRAILINTAIVGMAAVGMTAVTLSGNFFSLGIGATVVMAGILFLATADRYGSVLLAGIATVVAVSVLGAVQALIVSAGLNPIITTLAFGTIVYGTVAVTTGGEVVTAGATQVTALATTQVAGLPMPAVVFVLLAAVAAILANRSVMGRWMRLMGENRDTAVISGIPVLGTTMAAFLFMSLGGALAGIFSAAQLRQMQANDLPTLTMDIIAAVLVGGAAVAGGEASPIRSALGALLLVVLGNVMLLQGFAPGVRVFGVGVVTVLLVVALHFLRSRAGTR